MKMKMVKAFKFRLTVFYLLLFLSIIFIKVPEQALAYEYTGLTLELMNGKSTNFWGLGIFTSDKRFTAGITALLSTYMFSSEGASGDRSPDTHLSNRDYPFYALDFYGNYNFIRTPTTVYYVGLSIMPLIPTKYVYSYSFGVEFLQSEAVRLYFGFKNIRSNYVTNPDGNSSHLNRIAEGPQFLFGFKFAFLGKTKIVAKQVEYKSKTEDKKKK